MKCSRKSIGIRIRTLRNRTGLNQKEWAAVLGINNKTLSSYEQGDAYPSIDALAIIVTVSGCSFDWLICGSDTEAGETPYQDITEKEFILLDQYRRASQHDREILMRLAALMAASN